MRCIAISSIGVEDVVSKDIKEIIGKDSDIKKGCCLFEANEKEIAKFSYMCQSIERVGVLLKIGEMKEDPYCIDINDIEFKIDEKFGIGCRIIGEKPFKSNDVILDLSEKIKAKTDKKFVYKGNDTSYYVQVVDDVYYLIIDLSKKELSKRDYKIFANKTSLRGTLAYCIGRIAEISDKDKILDCFCRSGEIPLEIAHYLLGKSIHFYTKDKFKFGWDVNLDDFDDIKDKDTNIFAIDSSMPNLKAAEKNSKIAGLNKKINFSRTSIEDLDLKFNNDVDKIVVQLPAVGKDNENRTLNLYRDFFEICKEVLKEKGVIACIGLNIEQSVGVAKNNGYNIKHERKIMQGKEEMSMYLFEK